MTSIITILGALAVGLLAVLALDVIRRVYLLTFQRDDYKDNETDDDDGTYAADKEAEAIEILSRYRLTRWLVKNRR